MVVCCIITGGFFLAFGIYLWFWLDRRHFNRRNRYGTGEVFNSYTDMRKIRIIEFFFKRNMWSFHIFWNSHYTYWDSRGNFYLEIKEEAR